MTTNLNGLDQYIAKNSLNIFGIRAQCFDTRNIGGENWEAKTLLEVCDDDLNVLDRIVLKMTVKDNIDGNEVIAKYTLNLENSRGTKHCVELPITKDITEDQCEQWLVQKYSHVALTSRIMKKAKRFFKETLNLSR